MSTDDDKTHFAEQVGLVFEEAGLTRMAGRIMGWLLVCDPPHQTLNDLAETLQASKGSISGMTRYLMQLGLVERVSLPGERRDYFRLRPGSWTAIIERDLEMVRLIRQLAERGLTLLDDEPPPNRERLVELRDVYAFFERELPLLFERWKQESRSSAP